MLKEIVKKTGKVLGYSILGLFIVAMTLELYGAWYDEWSGYNATLVVSDGICNIAVIPIHGEIQAYENEYGFLEEGAAMVSPEGVRSMINLANEDPNINGILLRIDSVGGSPAGSIAIADALSEVSYPVLAFTGDYAASAGYLIATAADSILATPFSDIGSIGVTMSYLENTKQNEFDGLDYVPLTSAPYKDYGNPNKPLTEEERKLFERDLEIYHEEFVKVVAENRNLSVEEVSVLADGSSMPARLAIEKKLIDQIGNTATARAWFAEKLNIGEEEVILCE